MKTLSKQKALTILQKHATVTDRRFDPFLCREFTAAFDMAVRALRIYQDRKALGSKGGQRTAKLHAKKLSKWGKLGGRPRKKAA